MYTFAILAEWCRYENSITLNGSNQVDGLVSLGIGMLIKPGMEVETTWENYIDRGIWLL